MRLRSDNGFRSPYPPQAPGYTNEEIYEWMAKKLAAINQLREVLSYRQETIDSLKKLDQEITVLSQDVTLDIVQTN